MVNLVINDNSNSGKDVYVSIIGYQGDQWPTNADSLFSYMGVDGSVNVCQSGQSFVDFSFNLKDMVSGISLPYFSSGRLTISFDKMITSPPIQSGSEIINPSIVNVNDLNYHTIWNMMEFSNQLQPPTDTTVCNIDTTLVDAFSFPLKLTLVGGTYGTQTAGAMIASRDDLVTSFKSLSKDFTDQILYNASGNFVRITSPTMGVTGGAVPFPSGYFDTYIESNWKKYSMAPALVFDIPGYSEASPVSGTVNSSSVFEFTDATGDTYSIAKPSTTDMLGCAGPFVAAGSGVHFLKDGIVKRIVAAALNRGVLQSGTGFCNSEAFYKNEPVNEYAKLVHKLSVSGTNYAFPYDDVCTIYSSDIADGKPASVTIDLETWT